MRCCIFLILSIWITYSQALTMQQAFNKTGQKLETIKTLATNMANDVRTKVSMAGAGINVQAKVAVVQKKWEAAKVEYNNDRAAAAGKIKDAVSGVGTGLVGFVNGVKNGDWAKGVSGALTIISSVVALAGPVGVIASGILSLLSSIFGIFGGAKKPESTESKVERVVRQQIDIARQKDLEAAVQGVKVSYETLSNSIQDFREGKELETEQANELYNQAFVGLSVFGRIQNRIKEICDDLKDHVNGSKCLKTVQLYADVAITRQLVISDMAALLADVYHRKVDDEPIIEEIPVEDAVAEAAEVGSEEDKATKILKAKGLLVVSNNLLHLIKKDQEKDRKFLRFFGDPFNHPLRRYVISLYFASPDLYPSLKAYIRTLHDSVPGGLFTHEALICNQESLQGWCKPLPKGEYNRLPSFWRDAVGSLYVPLGLEITAYEHERLNAESRTYGPFYGPIAHNKAPGGSDWSSAKVSETSKDAELEARICSEENFKPGYCDTVEKADLINLWNHHGFNWNDKISSMYIPEGVAVDGYTEINKEGNHYEMFVGPHIINIVYDQNKWKSLWVRDAGEEIDGSNQVVFCAQEKLEGQCKTTWKSLYYLRGSYNMNWENKIYSMKIPGGYQVTGYTDISHQGISFGPYSGPAVIDRVDGGNNWKSMKLTEFTQDLPDSNPTKTKATQKEAKKEKKQKRKEKGKEKQRQF